MARPPEVIDPTGPLAPIPPSMRSHHRFLWLGVTFLVVAAGAIVVGILVASYCGITFQRACFYHPYSNVGGGLQGIAAGLIVLGLVLILARTAPTSAGKGVRHFFRDPRHTAWVSIGIALTVLLGFTSIPVLHPYSEVLTSTVQNEKATNLTVPVGSVVSGDWFIPGTGSVFFQIFYWDQGIPNNVVRGGSTGYFSFDAAHATYVIASTTPLGVPTYVNGTVAIPLFWPWGSLSPYPGGLDSPGAT